MQKKQIVKFAAALFLSIASLGVLSVGCIAEPDADELSIQEAPDAEEVISAEQALTGDCPNQDGCDAYCDSLGLVWKGCTLTTDRCRCGAENPTTGPGGV